MSEADLDAALALSLIKDDAGRAPGDQGYVETWSIYWAASLVSEVRAIRAMSQDQLEDFSAEGLRMKIKPADWNGVAAYFRGRAIGELQLGAGLSADGYGVIEIDRAVAPSAGPWPWLQGAITNAD